MSIENTTILIFCLILFAVMLYFAWDSYRRKLDAERQQERERSGRQLRAIKRRLSKTVVSSNQLKDQVKEMRIFFASREPANKTFSNTLTPRDAAEQRYIDDIKKVVSVNGKDVKTGE